MGTGPFSDFKCLGPGKRFLAGNKSIKSPKWIIQVVDTKETFEITAQHRVLKEGKSHNHTEAKVEIPASEKSMEVLSDPEVSNLISLSISDSLPFAMPIDLENRNIKQLRKRDKLKRLQPLPRGENLTVFSLIYDKKKDKWKPQIVGLAKNITSKKKLKDVPPDEPKKKFKQVHKWKLRLSKSKIDSDAEYFAQSSKGRGASFKEIGDKLDYTLAKYGLSRNPLLSAFIDTIASGYTGIRYGYPVVTGDPLISQATLVGIFAEVRGGPINGLRWYWDFSPRTTTVVEGNELFFEWSRPTFGWSFSREFNHFLLTRADIVPKVGWMNLEAKVYIPSQLENEDGSQAEGVTEEFTLENSFAAGIEIGIEKQTTWMLLRLWGAGDGAGFLNTLPGAGSTTSLRGGLDAYFDFVDYGSFESSVLLFTFGERISLSRNPSESAQLEEEAGVALEGISYILGFVGVGVTLTW